MTITNNDSSFYRAAYQPTARYKGRICGGGDDRNYSTSNRSGRGRPSPANACVTSSFIASAFHKEFKSEEQSIASLLGRVGCFTSIAPIISGSGIWMSRGGSLFADLGGAFC